MTDRPRVTAVTVLAGLLALAVACAPPPARTDRRLELELPASWSDAPGPERTGEGAAVAPDIASDWWRALGDEQLDALVDEALASAPDLDVLAARHAAARAAERAAAAAGGPELNAHFERLRAKRNFLGFPFGTGGVPVSRFSTYELSLEASWEIDLWGRLEAGEQAAVHDRLAAAADEAGARLSVSAAVTSAWLAWVEAAEQLALARATLASWEDHDALVGRRYARGAASALDRRLVGLRLAEARTTVTARERRLDDRRRVLELTVGRVPTGTPGAPGELPSPPPAPAPGLPVTLLARRPDLVAAERRLSAASLRIEQARDAFYPSLALTGAVGTSTEHLADVLDGDFTVWSILGRAVQPIWNRGRLAAAVELADAEASRALALFTRAVLDALGEVRGALDAVRWLAEEEAAWQAAAGEALATRDLAARRFGEGLAGALQLLEAERSLYATQSGRLAARRARLEAWVALHRALGGGSDPDGEHR